MDKLLFIGHTYHQKTKSSAFLLELLGKAYQITEFYTDPMAAPEYDKLNELPVNSFDVLVVWQVMPSIVELKKRITWKRAAFFPMYDHFVAIGGFNAKIWSEYRDFIVISFSRTLYKELRLCGFDARYIQYFPKPFEIDNWGDEDALFFWQRLTVLNLATLAKATKHFNISKIHLHHAPDPGNNVQSPSAYPEPVATFFKDKTCTESTWFEEKNQLYQTIMQSSLYMAPRHLEGIGMAFLKAMAMGRCVIAPDMATMNEYITDGVNGLLYPWDSASEDCCGAPASLPAASIRTIQENAYKTICDGYEKWNKDKLLILEWLQLNGKPSQHRLSRNAVTYGWEKKKLFSLGRWKK